MDHRITEALGQIGAILDDIAKLTRSQEIRDMVEEIGLYLDTLPDDIQDVVDEAEDAGKMQGQDEGYAEAYKEMESIEEARALRQREVLSALNLDPTTLPAAVLFDLRDAELI